MRQRIALGRMRKGHSNGCFEQQSPAVFSLDRGSRLVGRDGFLYTAPQMEALRYDIEEEMDEEEEKNRL